MKTITKKLTGLALATMLCVAPITYTQNKDSAIADIVIGGFYGSLLGAGLANIIFEAEPNISTLYSEKNDLEKKLRDITSDLNNEQNSLKTLQNPNSKQIAQLKIIKSKKNLFELAALALTLMGQPRLSRKIILEQETKKCILIIQENIRSKTNRKIDLEKKLQQIDEEIKATENSIKRHYNIAKIACVSAGLIGGIALANLEC